MQEVNIIGVGRVAEGLIQSVNTERWEVPGKNLEASDHIIISMWIHYNSPYLPSFFHTVCNMRMCFVIPCDIWSKYVCFLFFLLKIF